jgi:hypothetical protein
LYCWKHKKLVVNPLIALFVWLISHQPTLFFSPNKPATSNKSAVLFSQKRLAPAISHQPNVAVVQNLHATANLFFQKSGTVAGGQA